MTKSLSTYNNWLGVRSHASGVTARNYYVSVRSQVYKELNEYGRSALIEELLLDGDIKADALTAEAVKTALSAYVNGKKSLPTVYEDTSPIKRYRNSLFSQSGYVALSWRKAAGQRSDLAKEVELLADKAKELHKAELLEKLGRVYPTDADLDMYRVVERAEAILREARDQAQRIYDEALCRMGKILTEQDEGHTPVLKPDCGAAFAMYRRRTKVSFSGEQTMKYYEELRGAVLDELKNKGSCRLADYLNRHRDDLSDLVSLRAVEEAFTHYTDGKELKPVTDEGLEIGSTPYSWEHLADYRTYPGELYNMIKAAEKAYKAKQDDKES